MSRRPIIAGNWKMNKDINEAAALINELKPLVEGAEAEVVFCPPYVDLVEAVKLTEGTNIGIGAQNMHYETSHSERREYYNETDEAVNKKAIKALELGLTPIVCCGETLEEREGGKAEAKVVGQIKEGCKNIDDISKVVIAYEPIWAIGTGKTASKEEADEACGWVRKTIEEMYGKDAAEAVRVQYGGSVKPANVAELMDMPNIDGALVGGASLTADFAKIVKF